MYVGEDDEDSPFPDDWPQALSTRNRQKVVQIAQKQWKRCQVRLCFIVIPHCRPLQVQLFIPPEHSNSN
ncbi:MAG: hypothetical protein NVSMB27_31470 [Ktedonobacteraceae bacterium]